MNRKAHILRFTSAAAVAASAALLCRCTPPGAEAGPAGPVPATSGAQPMSRTITIGTGRYAGSTNEAIQKAVDDAAGGGGGVVVVPAGTYMMHDALHLRSGVRVVGRSGAVLKKVPSVHSRIPDYLGYGHYEFTAAEPEKFRAGMGVHLLDDKAGGFYTTVATIVGRKGDRFFIDRMLNHDYHPRANARAVSVYPLVEGYRVRDAGVAGLVLDGNHPAETFRLNGCRGGGVFLLQSQRVRVEDVEVRRYHGDALSFQQCADVLVTDCHLHHNTGHGLHPGSGSVRYVMRRVRSHHNGGCGIYYCLRTTHSILEDCQLHDNAREGVSIGTRDTDHLIRRNRIRGNALAGVSFRGAVRQGGDRTVLRANTIGPNCTKTGAYEIVLTRRLRDVLIEGNTIDPGKGKALRVETGCKGIWWTGNTVAGSPQQRADASIARDSQVSFEAPKDFPGVGPAALPADEARHLALPKLPPWSEP